MPELPEVETVKIALLEEILNEKILSVNVINKSLRYPVEKCFPKKIINLRIIDIKRRGKYLIFNLENNISFLAHLGMTGYFRFSKKKNIIKHDHLIFHFEKKKMIYNDIRKFGFFKVYNTRQIFKSTHLVNLGLEPLSKGLDAVFVFKSIKNSRQVIKDYLMNFKNLVGIGNIYSSEILFDSCIHPTKLSCKLNDSEIKRLIKSTKKILKNAIRLGGTSIKNYQDPKGKIGYFKNHLKVYGRDQKPCLKCKKGSIIKKIMLHGRSTFFCEKCQKI